MNITDNHAFSLYKTAFHFIVLYELSCRGATAFSVKSVLAHGYRAARYQLVNPRQTFMQVLCITLANTIGSLTVGVCCISDKMKKDGTITFRLPHKQAQQHHNYLLYS
ncbi:hypothetical protein G9X50_15740 [Cronobacter sakazakii]|uniref:hypothetical protein n=1 Tax=Cronobacter sakazakii TaxID=28141 RepID=UPI000CFD3378|nr:hypothetical protein [Cronobacter sakazakii]ELQ5982290.1 hypothetical protein [Cronobacter sakazakii]ELY3748548.1 hypothetical protein [Cronobacter sakazakii]NHV15015.1 hypothetical protein [Cronobacter sakazakii]NUW64618.1 hypothetical protein [Cronobacter sakazakii]